MTYKEKEKFFEPKVLKLLNQNKGVKTIARDLNVTVNLIKNIMKKNNILNSPAKKELLKPDFTYTQYQKEVLIGCILGDGYLSKRGNSVNGNLSHSVKQKEYLLHKKEIFSNCSGVLYEYEKDKRHEFSFRLKSNNYLKTIYDKYYTDKIKYLNPVILDELTDVSLAFWYMDDGWLKSGKYYYIATHCFTQEDLELLKTTLKTKFDLDINIFKDNSISIKATSSNKFYNLISPHIIPILQYKLGSPR
jgi:hypothetical protein